MRSTSEYNRFSPLKTLLHSDKIRVIVEGGIPIPALWHIYPTNACQNDCSFCIMRGERGAGGQLHPRVLERAVRDAARLGIRTVHFSGGGEPLMHPTIVDAMVLARELGVKVALSTNGRLLTQAVYDLADYPRVSVDAGTPRTHEKVKGPGGWGDMVEAIASLREAGKLGYGFVVVPENRTEVYEACANAARWGMGFVHIRPAYWPERDLEVQGSMWTVAEQAEAAAEDFPGLEVHFSKSKFDGYWTPRSYERCLATPLIAVLKASGRFAVCQDRLDLEFGDYNGQTFEEAWRSEEHRDAIGGIELNACPRCVENKKNEYIQNIFVEDKLLADML